MSSAVNLIVAICFVGHLQHSVGREQTIGKAWSSRRQEAVVGVGCILFNSSSWTVDGRDESKKSPKADSS